MNLRGSPTRRRSSVERLNLAAMIDVIFLLLIFFMATTTLSRPESQLVSGLRAEQASGQTSPSVPPIVEVGVFGGQASFRLGSRVFVDRDALVDVLREQPRDAGVFVKVFDGVDVSLVASALQACELAGFERVTYVASS
ncbi:MAG: ExbD/TolR family protein [Planctomycetota bacterium]|jgi:biopolymer transport protein ExbD